MQSLNDESLFIDEVMKSLKGPSDVFEIILQMS